MAPIEGPENTGQPDGRRERSERSREAIVQALLDLIREGHLSPTAEQVAIRADVGVRTVFRHFDDMDNLYSSINDRVTAEVSALFVTEDQTGPLPVRITQLVDRRCAFFERIAPFARATQIQRGRSEFVQREHVSLLRILRRDLRRWLPEIESVDREAVEALDAGLSFEVWNRLRLDQRLSAKRAVQTIERIVRAILIRQ